jgi:nicotinate dehydrogenase subunit A
MNSEANVIRFSVNGETLTAPSEQANTPLLQYLRDVQGLSRVRFGCGAASCGACTVICDGQAITSCDKLVSEIAGAKLETPECLESNGEFHPIVQKLIAHQAVQCGYCISGIAMRVKALLESNPNADEDALDAALDQHLCRCGTHVRIKRAVYELLTEKA